MRKYREKHTADILDLLDRTYRKHQLELGKSPQVIVSSPENIKKLRALFTDMPDNFRAITFSGAALLTYDEVMCL